MNRCPAIGDRVRHAGRYFDGVQYMGSVVGTVRRVWKKHDDVFDDDGELVRRGPLSPESEWQVTVEVDEVPWGWAYGPDCKRFAPEVADLEPV